MFVLFCLAGLSFIVCGTPSPTFCVIINRRGEQCPPVFAHLYCIHTQKRPPHDEAVFSKQFSFGCADYASSAKYLIVLTICDV